VIPNTDRTGASRRSAWPADDVMHDAGFRRLWASVLCSSFGNQFTLLALPLAAALWLQATPLQMGLLTAMETLPMALLALPAGVWLDRVRKLPLYIAGELTTALALASVPLAWWAGLLGMPWLYLVAFVVGAVASTAGSAGQIVLTQVVPRERLVQAHARTALASATAEVAGPGLAGLLIRWLGAPLALLADGLLLVTSAAILRGLPATEPLPPRQQRGFWAELLDGLRFVRQQPLLRALALLVGCWQLCHSAVAAVQILQASRGLGLSEAGIGLCYAVMGLATLAASTQGDRCSDRIGPGPTLLLGFGLCALGWLLPALLSASVLPRSAQVAAFVAMLVLDGVGGLLLYINFLALRQALTPAPLLGRMTSTVRWLILLPAGPGAVLGGWVGERLGLTATLGLAGGLGLLVVLLAWRGSSLRLARALPEAAVA